MGRITGLKRKKLWFEQETGQVYMRLWNNTHTAQKQFKITAGRNKNNEISNTYNGSLSQEWIDGRHWSSLWYVMLTKVMNSA